MMFEYLDVHLGIGFPVPIGWKCLSDLPPNLCSLLIFVGGVGAGKSTATQELLRQDRPGFAFVLLPDRRALTDRLIIAPLQREEGSPVRKLNRVERIPYIRRYHERYPAGLGYAITQLSIKLQAVPKASTTFLIFDGLRGEEELKFAYEVLPQARFIGLFAPELVRLERLLKRKDAYDTAAPSAAESYPSAQSPKTDLDLANIEGLFSLAEFQYLLELVQSGKVSANELRDKLDVLNMERSLYDLGATFAVLQTLSKKPDGQKRVLIIDTTLYLPSQVADLILNFITQPLQEKP